MAAELDGPRLEPRSGPARQLVVFLHGYGADGNDLIDIGRAWQGLLPDTAFVSPHAPEPCGQAPVGRQWFPLTFRDPNERWIGVNAAAPGARAFPRRRARAPQAAADGARAGRLQPGHHDGAACRAAPRRRAGRDRRLFRHVRAAGRRQRRTRSPARSSRKPPVLLVHGDRDDLIPAQALFHGAQGLAALGRPGRVAPLAGRRPRHRPGRAAPRRRIPGAALRPARLNPTPGTRHAGYSPQPRPAALHNPVTLPYRLWVPPLRRAAQRLSRSLA